jgi:hypothetical protein
MTLTQTSQCQQNRSIISSNIMPPQAPTIKSKQNLKSELQIINTSETLKINN